MAGDQPVTTDPLAPLDLRYFRDRIGTEFVAALADGTVALTLAAIEELPLSQRAGGGFRLELVGPRTAMLPQGTYSFTNDGAAHDIFIVPMDPGNADHARYEAVFF